MVKFEKCKYKSKIVRLTVPLISKVVGSLISKNVYLDLSFPLASSAIPLNHKQMRMRY